jgi:hypothetical protein
MEEKTKKIKNIRFEILAIILIAIFCIALSPVTLQNDTFYTIKVGESIIQNGVDMQDHFSWHENLPYTYPHWAYDVCIYFIYFLFGMNGIYISTCVLAVILGITMYKVNCKLVKNKPISFVITLLAMYLMEGYITARAQLLTFILFTLEIYFIESFLDSKKKRYAIGLIILPIIIANFHAAVWTFYFILFLPYIGEYCITILSDIVIYQKIRMKIINRKIIRLSKKQDKLNQIEELKQKLKLLEEKNEKIKIKREEEKKNPYKIIIKKNNNAKWLIIIMLICLLTGLLTPQNTFEPYTHIFKLMSGNTTQNINEHLPLTLINHTDILCAIIIFLAILIFTDSKIRLSDLFMLGGLTFLMFYSRRQRTMFIIAGAIILNRLLTGLMEKYFKGAIEKITLLLATKVGMFVTAGVVIMASMVIIKPKLNDTYIDESSYPVAACDWILENLDVENIKIFNDYNYGSYMLFRGIPVFIDSRCDLYSPEFNTKTGNAEDGQDIFMDYIETSGLSKFYGDTFEKYGITHLITMKNSKINMIIKKADSENYNKLYSDDKFVIYEVVANN